MVAKAVPGCWEAVAPLTLCRVRAIAAAEALGEACSAAARLLTCWRPSPSCGVPRPAVTAPAGSWPPPTLASGRPSAPRSAPVGWPRSGRRAPHCASTGATGTSLPSSRTAWGESTPTCWPPGRRRCRPRCCATTAAGARRSGTGPCRSWRHAGLLHADGRATDAGRTLHGAVEEQTDRLALPPYAQLGDVVLADLHGALAACAREVVASGVLPFPNPMGLPRVT